jgi:hypothetical protein
MRVLFVAVQRRRLLLRSLRGRRSSLRWGRVASASSSGGIYRAQDLSEDGPSMRAGEGRSRFLVGWQLGGFLKMLCSKRAEASCSGEELLLNTFILSSSIY